MSLQFRIFSAVLALILISFTMFWIAAALVGQKPRWKSFLLFCIEFGVAECLRQIMLPFLVGEEAAAGTMSSVAGYVAQAIVLCLILWKMHRVPLVRTLAAAALGNFVSYTIFDFLTEASYVYSPAFDGRHLFVATTIYLPYTLSLVMVGMIVFVLNKTEFHLYFSYLFRGWLRTAATLAVSFLLMNTKILLDFVFPDATTDIPYGIFCLSLIVLSLFCIQFSAMYAAGKDKIKAQEETILQQQAHMELLEELQQEIRSFRHDFTNLLSGMALSAQEGDLQSIQEFMGRTSGYFDEKLGNEIRQMEGLSNVRVYPVRSLLFAKLNLMRQRRIRAALEIMNPVTAVSMSTEDLLRCQGILLDNAIEAAAKENGEVRIVLFQEGKELYIAVANNYDARPDLASLGKGGYTTKGKGHGTGLSSYRKLVSHCPGCMTRTYLKDDFFVQELRIPV